MWHIDDTKYFSEKLQLGILIEDYQIQILLHSLSCCFLWCVLHVLGLKINVAHHLLATNIAQSKGDHYVRSANEGPV